MQIRTAREEDISSIQKLISSGKPFVAPYHEYIYWVFTNYFSSSCLVAMEQEELIGFLCALPSKDHNSMFIMQIYTHKAKSGRGVATELLEHLRRDCLRENIASMEFSICSANEKSLGLFRSFAKKIGGKITKSKHTFYGEVDEIGYRLEFR